MLDVHEFAMISLRIKKFEVTLPANVVTDLAVPLLLGTLFIYSYLMGFSPQDNTIWLINGENIDIVDHDGRAAPVRGVQGVYLTPVSKTVVWCGTNRTGVSILRSANYRLDKLYAAHGLVETENGFASIRVANCFKTDRMLSSGTLHGDALHIEQLINLSEETF